MDLEEINREIADTYRGDLEHNARFAAQYDPSTERASAAAVEVEPSLVIDAADVKDAFGGMDDARRYGLGPRAGGPLRQRIIEMLDRDAARLSPPGLRHPADVAYWKRQVIRKHMDPRSRDQVLEQLEIADEARAQRQVASRRFDRFVADMEFQRLAADWESMPARVDQV